MSGEKQNSSRIGVEIEQIIQMCPILTSFCPSLKMACNHVNMYMMTAPMKYEWKPGREPVYCLLFTGYCSRPDRMADDEHMSREQLRQI